MSSQQIRLATRGSDLALRQAGEVVDTLEDRRHDVELVEVETEGDRVTDALISDLGKTGAFVRALDQEVMEGTVDAAVHSMKDVPTEVPEDLVVAAVPHRENPADVLVTPGGTDLEDLPAGSVVGTASLRRGAQVQAHRPGLDVEPIRGNVGTRVEKLLAPALHREHERRTEAEKEAQSRDAREQRRGDYTADIEAGVENLDTEDGEKRAPDDGDDTASSSEFEQSVTEWFDSLTPLQQSAMERDPDTEYDALVMARVGLERTGLLHHVGIEELSTGTHVPATGQGALCVTARRDSDVVDTLRDALEHVRTRVEVTAERVVLEELGGGCIAPIGVHALVQGDTIRTAVQVFSQDGSEQVGETRELDAEQYATDARELAADLRDRGAADLIEDARTEA
ncbi:MULTISPECIES: hydroxymethylbilane synthase [Halobacterium]|uniref:Hydroxymethylbilane synthase n=1 Tax=Halobacterium salinarum (strain ATCC 33171 / DSM 3754 / JCM 8978 / NBRC 102687 / NCIMB 764 / 91-R6) TaxID=2597657 RepID=A0A4D6GVX3_HALS9|nr:hydroxymethylbilane synthase [Halobacterium salinarum]MDL0123575.1 hydroxymethylbilane synthase [Halobacterium salinarum]MDL0124211.1 hydroxymethylbilane synthase [Halobacterium salinarum]MDL0128822.1 hydroxymethylbilane synthase [Halobacterium salinarum]MDL0144264.1 hydroxymethylbilane synthase [Halobacterium salinarum]QCC45933.1 hydroxymethylbilane synthase (porphobilinogen deaminase) [Halobacterium salinarum]